VTYDVHGTSPGNELNQVLTFVNNVAGDFTSPQPTTALQSIRIRCGDPNGAPAFTIACTEDISSGQASCAPGCYSASFGIVKMQVQIDPAVGQSGQVRVGLSPNHVCGDQTEVPVYFVSQ
jgi:hypothetical protein